MTGPDEEGIAGEALASDEAQGQPRDQSEGEARKYGWKPREEFTLNPDAWRPASEFMELPQTQRKILRDEVRREVQADFGDRFTKLERSTSFAVEQARRQERERFEGELASLRAQKAEAVASADTETYQALEQRESELRDRAPVEREPAPQRAHPDVVTYAQSEAGAWMRDGDLVNFAREAIDAAIKADPLVGRLPPVKQIALAEKKLREYGLLAERQEPRQEDRRGSRVDGGGLGGRRAKAITDLPAEAQRAFADFKRQGIKITEAQYIEQYEA